MSGQQDTSPVFDIEFRDVSVRYDHLPALEHVSFGIPHGSFWGIIGPNGSGKSTLVKTALGLLRPYHGSVRTLGYDPADLGPRRARLGYVPQYATLDFTFPLEVIDVVTMGLYGQIGIFRRITGAHRARAFEALERVQMQDFAQRQISMLSGGQRQRVLIARALAVNPALLILDEPTAALDHSSSEGLYEWINDLHRASGMTIVLVTHDIGVVSEYVDSVACLNRTLVAHGRPVDVLHTPTLENMYGCGAVLFGHGEVPHMVVRKEQARE
ncbi:MAG: metal ABC transporter ATP-binding protein [Bacteroidota bacterium]|jgi:zinc transport system ATP-binding protein|nr:metal ABC transporter ATP-binding protein [Bacteroidota bacterium]